MYGFFRSPIIALVGIGIYFMYLRRGSDGPKSLTLQQALWLPVVAASSGLLALMYFEDQNVWLKPVFWLYLGVGVAVGASSLLGTATKNRNKVYMALSGAIILGVITIARLFPNFIFILTVVLTVPAGILGLLFGYFNAE